MSNDRFTIATFDPGLLRLLVASSIGGVCVSLITVPLDVMKVRLQTAGTITIPAFSSCQLYLRKLCLCSETCQISPITNARPNVLANTSSIFRKILEETGARGLWKGLTPTMIQVIPQVTIYYTLYQKIKFKLGFDQSDPTKAHVPIVSGVLARSAAGLAVAPLELVRTNLQASSSINYRRLYRIATNSIKSEGVTSLWRSFIPMMLRDIPFTSVYWYLFEKFKYKLQTYLYTTEHDVIITFISAITSGMVCAYITTPLDVIKTNMEVSIKQSTGSKQSVMNVARAVYHRGGLRGFFEGVLPRCAKIGPGCAIMITTYEITIRLMKNFN